MKFLGSWLFWTVIGFIICCILANIFFDYTWMESRSEIPEASFWTSLFFGLLTALYDASKRF